MAGRRVERFLTTVLFTDIVGSTELAAELGDRGWRDLVQEHHRLVRAALRRNGGHEVDTAGDGFFAVFDAPAAAVECALEIGPAVEPLGLQVRAGLHVGEVEQIAGKVGGITVPIAARIMSAAGAGEVLVSGTLRDLSAGAGLHFEDHGTRELKGVPGEWHLYAVTRTGGEGATAGLGDADRIARRATAVRRAQARPIWQRHPRGAAAVVVAVMLILVATGLWVWKPWLPPALAAVAENSLGVIDPGRDVIVGQAAVGDQPSAIAVGEGWVWVANTGDDTVSQIDPQTHAVIDTIDVGKSPTGIVVGAGSVWVADSGERSVTRINAATRRVVDTITVGNGPRAVAFGAGAVWVANGGDGTVTRIDTATGKPGGPISLASLPTAIAADDTGAWVASEDGGTVTHLDPHMGVALAAPIAVGTRPAAVVIGDGAVWVANSSDGSVSRIDPASHHVVGVVDVGGSPVGLAVAAGILWIADSSGAIERVDEQNLSAGPTRISAGSAPVAIAAVANGIWFVAKPSTTSHRGGTLRVVPVDSPQVDPTLMLPTLAALVADGLVGYRHVGGIAGTTLMPDLATSIPRPTDGGLTYAFQLRDGLVYSDGSPIHASDVRFVIERSFQIAEAGGPPLGPGSFGALVGADACTRADGTPVQRCDLAKGIVADDAAKTITFHLTTPDPDFLYKLALPMARALPPRAVPADQVTKAPYPVTGPYEFASVTDNEVRLVRNPHFHSVDPSVRPDGYPDQIIWTSGFSPSDQVAMVEAGKADYLYGPIPSDAFPELRTAYTPQLHLAVGQTTYLFMNTKKPPFDNLDVRKAVNLAIDRAHVVELLGGAIAAETTCQVLPPNFPGYEPYCPYTKDPSLSGTWSAPDLDTARKLVAASGTMGMKVTVGPMSHFLPPQLPEYVASVLRDLGYDATVDTTGENPGKAIFVDKRVQIGAFTFFADFPAPDTFLGQFTCNGGDASNYCSPDLDALIAQASDLQASDPAAANAKWAEVDRWVVDHAPWVPLVNEGSAFVSSRLGNYQWNPAIGILLDQAWVQ